MDWNTLPGLALYNSWLLSVHRGRNKIGQEEPRYSASRPGFGVLTSALILQEAVSIWTVVSLALIMTGVYLVNAKRAA